jgi:hypothetical protein
MIERRLRSVQDARHAFGSRLLYDWPRRWQTLPPGGWGRTWGRQMAARGGGATGQSHDARFDDAARTGKKLRRYQRDHACGIGRAHRSLTRHNATAKLESPAASR